MRCRPADSGRSVAPLVVAPGVPCRALSCSQQARAFFTRARVCVYFVVGSVGEGVCAALLVFVVAGIDLVEVCFLMVLEMDVRVRCVFDPLACHSCNLDCLASCAFYLYMSRF